MMQEAFKRKCRPLNNRSKSLDEIPKKILKVDLYSNLVKLMEEGKLDLIEDKEMRKSLESIHFEQEEDKTKISGEYSHLVEALIRACWCIKEKNLKPFVLSF